MSKPMSPATLLTTLRAEGLTVIEYTGWRDRCRCCSGTHRVDGPYIRGWGDVNGTVTHITAGGLSGRSVESYIRDIINGDKNVPCKAQFVVSPEGHVYLNSAGRCNHAGKVGGSVRAHMLAADFSTSDNFDNRFTGGAADGNSFTYGIENIAAKTMTDEQYRASVLINAAIARHYGWSGQESVGHGEISNQRGVGDPNLDMSKFRRAVMSQVVAGPATTVPPTPKPPVTPKPEPVPPKEPEPTPAKAESSVLLLNCASKRSDVGAGSWAKRKATLIKMILESDASFIVCPELYSGQRGDITKGIAGRYALAGYREGRVIYRRKGRWSKTTSSFWKNLLAGAAKGKPAVGIGFKHQDSGEYLTIIGMHTSFETGGSGPANRRREVATVIDWAKRRFTKNVGRRIYAGDFNAPAGSTTRPDDVGPVFAAHGYHDLGMDTRPKTGPGHYHLDRAFGGHGVEGTHVVVVSHAGSDHPATFIQFTY